MALQKKRRASWQSTLVLAALCFLFSLVGMLFLLLSAKEEVNRTFSRSDTAVPIRDVNGLAQDGAGNFYIGCGGSSSIQVFDREGRFRYRLCVPTYKAGRASFAWTLEGETLRIFSYRGPVCLTVKDGKVIGQETYPGRDALEDAMMAEGLPPEGGKPAGQSADGSRLRLDLFGRLRVTDADGATRLISLEAPHFPPPFLLCWGMMLGGTGGMLFLLRRALDGKKRKRGLDNSRHIG